MIKSLGKSGNAVSRRLPKNGFRNENWTLESATLKDDKAMVEGQSVPIVLKALRIQLDAGASHDRIRERLADLLQIINQLPEEAAREEFIGKHDILLDNLNES